MVYKWNEINLELFKDIFTAFWNHDPWTIGKVLEVQNLQAIKDGYPDIRIYFGADIKLKDWEKYNQFTLNLLDIYSITTETIEKYKKLSICMLSGRAPRISPIGLGDHFKMVWHDFFGGLADGKEEDETSKLDNNRKAQMNLWYVKGEDGQRICDIEKGASQEYTDEEKFVRIRTMDYSDWLEIVSNFVNSERADLSGCSEDLKPGDITILKYISPSENKRLNEILSDLPRSYYDEDEEEEEEDWNEDDDSGETDYDY